MIIVGFTFNVIEIKQSLAIYLYLHFIIYIYLDKWKKDNNYKVYMEAAL